MSAQAFGSGNPPGCAGGCARVIPAFWAMDRPVLLRHADDGVPRRRKSAPTFRDGADRSPPLRWEGAPAGTAAVAIVVDDTDAGGFVHWVAWNLPADVTAIEAGASPGGPMPAGSVEGKNDFGRAGYGGPCPPRGKEHRYRFRVYALAAPLGVGPGASRADLERALTGQAIAAGELTGRYRRP